MRLRLIFLCRELLQTATAADFYTVMAQLGERLRKAQLLPSPEFMQVREGVDIVLGFVTVVLTNETQACISLCSKGTSHVPAPRHTIAIYTLRVVWE